MENLKVLKTTINSSLDKEKSTKLTGYPSIDKPWMQFYKEKEKDNSPIEHTLYEYLHECNRGNLHSTALDYFGKKITYNQMFEKIDKCAEALIKCGVKPGDYITMSLPNCPEAVYILYAANKLGVVVNSVDPRTNPEDMKKYINETNSKMFLALDMCYENVKDILPETTAKKIVTISPANSMPLIMSVLYKLKTKSGKLACNQNLMDYDRFIKNGKGALVIPKKYEKDYPAVIVRTGGTTGEPKGVVLSNDSIHGVLKNNEEGEVNYQRGQDFLDILPPFISYGIGNALHLGLCFGMRLILVPALTTEDFPKLLTKYSPHHVCGSPVHWEQLLVDARAAKADYSKLITAGSGGDSMSASLQKQISDFIRKRGCHYMISQGYGMSETVAGVCYARSNECNEMGSVGIPWPLNIVSIFDPETNEELPYGEIGEICFDTPSRMIGYYGDKAKMTGIDYRNITSRMIGYYGDKASETGKVLKKHKDGKIWVHTGDLGHITERGIVYIDGRIKRIINRSGMKIFPDKVENVLITHPAVEACSVVGLVHKEERHVPIANVKLKEGFTLNNRLKEQLQTLCAEKLFDYALPYEYIEIEEMPLTPIGKVNYRALEQLDYELLAPNDSKILENEEAREQGMVKKLKRQ